MNGNSEFIDYFIKYPHGYYITVVLKYLFKSSICAMCLEKKLLKEVCLPT